MKMAAADLPLTLDMDGAKIREAEWGEMHVSYETYEKRFDVTPWLKGLPQDRDQCPHWGYVLKGEMRVVYANRQDIVRTGEMYYSEPGHTTILEAGTQIVEFSPKDLLKKTMAVIEKNMAAKKK